MQKGDQSSEKDSDHLKHKQANEEIRTDDLISSFYFYIDCGLYFFIIIHAPAGQGDIIRCDVVSDRGHYKEGRSCLTRSN